MEKEIVKETLKDLSSATTATVYKFFKRFGPDATKSQGNFPEWERPNKKCKVDFETHSLKELEFKPSSCHFTITYL